MLKNMPQKLMRNYSRYSCICRCPRPRPVAHEVVSITYSLKLTRKRACTGGGKRSRVEQSLRTHPVCNQIGSVESTPLLHHLLRLADACLLAPAVANCSFIICSRALLNNLLLPFLLTGVDLRPRVIGLEVPGTTPGRKRRGVSRGGSPHCCGKQTGGRPCAEGRSKAIERRTSHLRHAAEPHPKQGTDGSTAAVKYLVMSSMWSSLPD